MGRESKSKSGRTFQSKGLIGWERLWKQVGQKKQWEMMSMNKDEQRKRKKYKNKAGWIFYRGGEPEHRDITASFISLSIHSLTFKQLTVFPTS